MSVKHSPTHSEENLLRRRADYAQMHETRPHGSLRFHFQLYEILPDPRWPAPISPHWHEEYELLMITGGKGTAFLGNRRIEVGSGDILFIDGGIIHSLFTAESESDPPLAFSALVFGQDLLSSCGSDDIQQQFFSRHQSGELVFREIIRPSDPVWEKIRDAFDEIRSFEGKEEENKLLIKAGLLRIWHFLALSACSSRSDEKESGRKALLIKETLSFIHENYGQDLTLKELADRVHLSEGQFCRFFRSEIGMTAVEYLNFYRIGIACTRLTQKSLPIWEIALDCGYNNISYFNRTFRRYMHCTPGEYRKMQSELR